MSKIFAIQIPVLPLSDVPTPGFGEGASIFLDSENANALTMVNGDNSGVATVAVVNYPQQTLTALVSEAGTAAPTITAVQTSLPKTLTLTPARTSAGLYTITANSAVFATGTQATLTNIGVGFAKVNVTSATVLTLHTYDVAGAAADAIITAASLSVVIPSTF